MDRNRRRLRPLLVVLAGFALVTAGCLGSTVPGNATTEPDRTLASFTETPTETPHQHGQDSARALGDPVVTSGTVERDDLRYYPENETIRFVADSGGRYGFVSFERWAAIEAASVAAGAVADAVLNRTTLDRPGIGTAIPVRGTPSTVIVSRSRLLDRDGDLLRESNISYERLREVAPAEVTATIQFRNRTATRTYDVVVENRTIHQD